jgi:hypothetical protein
MTLDSWRTLGLAAALFAAALAGCGKSKQTPLRAGAAGADGGGGGGSGGGGESGSSAGAGASGVSGSSAGAGGSGGSPDADADAAADAVDVASDGPVDAPMEAPPVGKPCRVTEDCGDPRYQCFIHAVLTSCPADRIGTCQFSLGGGNCALHANRCDCFGANPAVTCADFPGTVCSPEPVTASAVAPCWGCVAASP